LSVQRAAHFAPAEVVTFLIAKAALEPSVMDRTLVVIFDTNELLQLDDEGCI